VVARPTTHRPEPRPPILRYEREQPGELIHIDTKKLGRITGIGHRITGNLAWFKQQGVTVQRVIADNGSATKRRLFAAASWRGPQTHSPRHAKDQRQSRTLHPKQHSGVGICQTAPHLGRTTRRPPALAAQRQHRTTTHSTRWKTSRHQAQYGQNPG